MDQYYDEAAKYLGTSVIDAGHKTRQALILSNGSHIHKYSLGSVNRNINVTWKNEMKSTLKDLHAQKERTMLTACIDERCIKAAMDDPEACQDFKAVILDGQHRAEALKELITENKDYEAYEFWVVLYITRTDEEMEQLLKDLDKRFTFTDDDIITVDARMRFIKALKELIPGQENRRCITGTINHAILRETDIIESIKKCSKHQIVERMIKTSQTYKNKFEQSKLSKGALHDTIVATKLYQLIDWQSGLWIREMFA